MYCELGNLVKLWDRVDGVVFEKVGVVLSVVGVASGILWYNVLVGNVVVHRAAFQLEEILG